MSTLVDRLCSIKVAAQRQTAFPKLLELKKLNTITMHQGKCSQLAKVRTTWASQKAIKGERVIILNGEGGALLRERQQQQTVKFILTGEANTHTGKQESRAFFLQACVSAAE